MPRGFDLNENLRSPQCIWFRGFLANRKDLQRAHNLSPALGDRQIVAALFERYGPRVLSLAAGPCSFVLWEPRRRELLAVRDRLGTLGLHFEASPTGLNVAEHAHDLAGAWSWSDLNHRSIALHILGYPPHRGETFHSRVQALPPGGALLATQRGWTVQQYWQPSAPTPLRLRDDREYADALLDLLVEVVDQYLAAGSRGVTLSSGLDSTSVAAILKHQRPASPPLAFTWVAPDLPEADESQPARTVRQHLNLCGVEIPVGHLGPMAQDLTTQAHPDGPQKSFFDNVWHATFSAAKESGVSCLYTGASGDHLFGGNIFSYPDLLLTGRWKRLATEIRSHLRFSDLTFLQLLRAMVFRPIAVAWARASPRLDEDLPPWLSESLRRDLSEEEEAPSFSLLPGRCLRLRELRDLSLPETCRQLNELARDHGLDLRHPLLDHRLFDFAAALPSEQTFAAGLRKIVLRNAMRQLLPEETLARQRKIVPRAIAQRSLLDSGTDQAFLLLREMRAAELGLVDEKGLLAAYIRFREVRQGRPLFFYAMTLEAWLRRYF